ncbi:ATP-binding protein [Geodermatophilus sp. SYSU D01105]
MRAASGFLHETVTYRGDEGFLDGVLGFVRAGLDRDEDVVVVEPRPRLGLLRDALGSDSAAVELLDMTQVGANPGRIIGVWAPLPPPGEVVLRGGFREADLPDVRRTVATYARSCDLPAERVEALALAASELATDSVRHGEGGGTLAMWRQPGAAVVEFTDAGRLTDPLVGRRLPDPTRLGGRGVYLVHQLCDLVQVRSSSRGTTVRVTTWL